MTVRDYPPLADLTREQMQHVLSLEYARYIKCLVRTGGVYESVALWRELYPRSLTLTKAAVNPGTVAEPAWGAPLAILTPARDAFVARAHAQTILGRLQGARAVPFQSSGAFQTSSATYAWVGESAPK